MHMDGRVVRYNFNDMIDIIPSHRIGRRLGSLFLNI